MSLLFMDGFDDGLMAMKWSSNNMTVTTATKRTGTSSLNGPNGGDAHYSLSVAQQHATLIVGMAQNHSGLPAGGRRQWRFQGDSGATTHISLVRNSNAGIDVYRGPTFGDTLLASSAPNLIPLNTWNYVETKVTLSDTVGVVQVKVNGVQVINFSGDTKNGGTATVFDRFSIGANTGDGLGCYIDDLYLLNGAGAALNDFAGDVVIETLYPSGNGNSSQLVGSDGNSTDNYLLVDEAGTPVTTDYVGSAVNGEKDTYVYSNLTRVTGTVLGVALRSYSAKTESGAKSISNVVRSGATDSVQTAQALSTSYLIQTDLLEQNPVGPAAWTISSVNAAEFGVQVAA